MHCALASVAAVIFACGLAPATTTFAAPAAESGPFVVAEWGSGGYGGTPKGSRDGGGYGGGENKGGGWQQKPSQDDSDYTPSKKPDGYDDEDYHPKEKGGYGEGEQGGPVDDECIGHAGTQVPAHCGGQQDNGGNAQPSGDRTACKTACDKKCKEDFVPGSSKQKSCSSRCVRVCR